MNKCWQCKYYSEVGYKWGECLHYPCMAEPNDPACNDFEEWIEPQDPACKEFEEKGGEA